MGTYGTANGIIIKQSSTGGSILGLSAGDVKFQVTSLGRITATDGTIGNFSFRDSNFVANDDSVALVGETSGGYSAVTLKDGMVGAKATYLTIYHPDEIRLAAPSITFSSAISISALDMDGAHVPDAKTNYTTGELDTESEIVSAFNTTNGKINTILSRLESAGILNTS